jgi:hypothetical protein
LRQIVEIEAFLCPAGARVPATNDHAAYLIHRSVWFCCRLAADRRNAPAKENAGPEAGVFVSR